MGNEDHFWKLEHLSDRQLLERLQGVLRAQRCALAELIAHLGEVEERRLHLVAAHSSLFSYCVGQLGMSEDEACRRIELARLARKFPLLFGELASGRISLSVALLLKPVLTPDNHAALIAAARGTSMRAARELLAARFPSPDVPSRILKLPERRVARATHAAMDDGVGAIRGAAAGVANATRATVDGGVGGILVAVAVADAANAVAAAAADTVAAPVADVALAHVTIPDGAPGVSLLQVSPPPAPSSHAPAQASSPRSADPVRPMHSGQRIDPLSAERYRIQFTAGLSLKQKLKLARNLLRHSNPNGDFAPIVSRALDLLLQELMQRRFGARRKDTPLRSDRTAARSAPAPAEAQPSERRASSAPAVTIPTPAGPVAVASVSAPSPAATPLAATPLPQAAPVPHPQAARVAILLATTPPAAVPSVATPASQIARAARHAVLERDGLGCGWVDAAGNRCGSTAWLELDHRHPSGKGGRSEPENLRLLCRAHNRFAAERVYGREHVQRAIQARQQDARRRGQSARPPSSSPAPA